MAAKSPTGKGLCSQPPGQITGQTRIPEIQLRCPDGSFSTLAVYGFSKEVTPEASRTGSHSPGDRVSLVNEPAPRK